METTIIIAAVCAVVFAVIGFIAGGIYRKKTAETLIGSANDEAARIVSQAMNEAETKKREAILEAKDEIHQLKVFSSKFFLLFRHSFLKFRYILNGLAPSAASCHSELVSITKKKMGITHHI